MLNEDDGEIYILRQRLKKTFKGVITGDHRKFCQVNLKDQSKICISFIKEVPDQRGLYVAETDKICVDNRRLPLLFHWKEIWSYDYKRTLFRQVLPSQRLEMLE